MPASTTRFDSAADRNAGARRSLVMLALLLAALPGFRSATGADDRAARDDEARAAANPVPAPLPSDEAQRDATKLVRELHGAKIDAARTPQAKIDLSKELLRQALETRSDPAGEYVLLVKARELAVAGGDAAGAMQIIDETARSFRIDALTAKQEALVAMSKPALAKPLSDAASAVVDEAVAADNYDVAKPVAAIGLSAARRAKDVDLVHQWLARGKELDELRAAFERVKAALATLNEKPLDPQANLTIGRYRVFTKADWDAGLPMLALSDDPALGPLAIRELTPPTEAEEQAKLADAWWDVTETQDADAKDQLQARALFWYDKALPGLSGLSKARVEKRLQDLAARIYVKAQAAVRSRKWLQTPPAGPNRGQQFFDVPEEGALLIGFDVGFSDTDVGKSSIRLLRPIFRGARGEFKGAQHGGRNRGDIVTVKAKEGFAVGGMTVRFGDHLDGFSITFMQVQGIGLNPRINYTSEWIGGRSKNADFRMGGSGTPVLGIGGKADDMLQMFWLILAR